MSAFIQMVRNYAQAYGANEEGQGMVEYSLIVGTISLVIIFAFLTGGIQGAITGLSETVTEAINGAPTGPSVPSGT